MLHSIYILHLCMGTFTNVVTSISGMNSDKCMYLCICVYMYIYICIHMIGEVREIASKYVITYLNIRGWECIGVLSTLDPYPLPLPFQPLSTGAVGENAKVFQADVLLLSLKSFGVHVRIRLGGLVMAR
jgi:hypothetical protein